MKAQQLLTYSFPPNVGAFDRVFRIVSGAALAVLPWIGPLDLPTALGVVATVFGIAWLMTGVVSRCGMYHLFGLNTRRG